MRTDPGEPARNMTLLLVEQLLLEDFLPEIPGKNFVPQRFPEVVKVAVIEIDAVGIAEAEVHEVEGDGIMGRAFEHGHEIEGHHAADALFWVG